MEDYLRIVKKVLDEGKLKTNRTGVDTLAIFGEQYRHDMSEGFPLLTTKRVPFRLAASELEFFIKGITDKKWLQERNNHIWDEWCNPEIVPYGHDAKTKQKMMTERDLGPIYGFQWRHEGAEYTAYDDNYVGKGNDQLADIINTLQTNKHDRRMMVNSWHHKDMDKMALPPCHYGFQVIIIDNKLNLAWNQRSVDTMLGLPFNIASYGLLLHLLAKESGFEEGELVGHLTDVHIYENHIEGAKRQLEREPRPLPKVETVDFDSIFNWEYTQSSVKDYKPHPGIKFDIAV